MSIPICKKGVVYVPFCKKEVVVGDCGDGRVYIRRHISLPTAISLQQDGILLLPWFEVMASV
jgi:hypothetical protein